MALKNYNPTTPSQRQLVNIDRSGLHKGPPVKALTEGKSSTGGRNNNGRTTVRFRGGGHKKAYRKVDFRRAKFDVPATVERRARLYSGAAAALARRQRDRRRACRREAGQRHADRQYSGRHHRA
jgi:ribosomal protein L2